MSNATDGSLADVFVDVGGLIEQSGDKVDPGTLKATRIDRPRAAGSDRRRQRRAGLENIEVDLASDLGEFEEGFVGSAATEMLGSLPSTSFAAFASSEVGKRLGEAIDKVDEEGISGEVPPHKLKSTLKSAGIDLEKIAASLGDAGVFATGNSRSSLGGALVFSTDSSSEAKNAVAGIGLLLRASHTPGVTAIGGNATGFSIHSDELGNKPVVVATEGERLAIGYGVPATLLGLKAGSGKTLADSPTYKEAVSALGEHADQRLRRRPGGAQPRQRPGACVRRGLPGSEAVPAEDRLRRPRLLQGRERRQGEADRRGRQVGTGSVASGVGIDLLEIDRLERALERHPRLAERVFTEAERSYAAARRRPGRHLAARFAAKEAVVKALGLSDGFGLREIEVIAGEPPRVGLSGRAARAAAGSEVQVSLTHSREHAAAVAVVS